jgi:mannosyltransferase OCH1-like enzyme
MADIPKIIHYCWFGEKPLSALANNCIESWTRYLPDYQLKFWNNEHIDMFDIPYVQEAYQNKKFAFVTDYVRLYALQQYGGIYMDTDVEVMANLDGFLNQSFFTSFEEYMDKVSILTALMGSVPGNKVVADLIQLYDNRRFVFEDGTLDLMPNTTVFKQYVENRYGLKPPFNPDKPFELGENGIIYPSGYFCTPKSGVKNYTTHHFSGSWLTPKQRLKKALYKYFKIPINLL